jgi:hypothetical protein
VRRALLAGDGMVVTSKFFTVSGALAAALSAAAALTSGCGPADEAAPGAERVTRRGPLAFQSFEEFRATAYREPWPGGVYVVDHDVPVSDDDELRAYYERLRVGDTALVVGTNGGKSIAWPPERRLALTYCVNDASMSSDEKLTVVDALDKAAARWEAIADVDFVHVKDQDGRCGPDNDAVLFNVEKVDSGDGVYFARAFFPDDPRSERQLNIDVSAFDPRQSSIVDDVMTHELGHVLGFQHEHGRNEASKASDICDENNEGWLAVTPYDANSVMHYPECRGQERGTFAISSRDEWGVVALYGSPGRVQPVDAVATTYRYATSGSPENSFLNKPFRARGGSTFVAVLKGADGSIDPNLVVSFSPDAADEPECAPALVAAGVPEACRVTIRGADRDVYVGTQVVGGDFNVALALTVVYVPADG